MKIIELQMFFKKNIKYFQKLKLVLEISLIPGKILNALMPVLLGVVGSEKYFSEDAIIAVASQLDL